MRALILEVGEKDGEKVPHFRIDFFLTPQIVAAPSKQNKTTTR
jgi:hypothetical protein